MSLILNGLSASAAVSMTAQDPSHDDTGGPFVWPSVTVPSSFRRRDVSHSSLSSSSSSWNSFDDRSDRVALSGGDEGGDRFPGGWTSGSNGRVMFYRTIVVLGAGVMLWGMQSNEDRTRPTKSTSIESREQ